MTRDVVAAPGTALASDASNEFVTIDWVRPEGERSGLRRSFVHIPRAATRRWFVLLLLVVVALAPPAPGAARAQKTIVISISHQMLWAYKGDQVVLSSSVSTGRAGFETPVGSFAVLTKLPSQTMEGVIGGEYSTCPMSRGCSISPTAATLCMARTGITILAPR